MPVTSISFPIDEKRVRLLGQLEYYFSLQNLAQDLYLRRQMDSRGWIPIELIASFKRVQRQTQDVQLVLEVLKLSDLVEVRDSYVRLRNGQWQGVVLPDATPTVFEETNVEGDIDEEDEDDVVFVMHETKQS
ncbi:winged helix DNA-binding domain-containing protein [Schizopora paradoxa]|uniref:Winged helix DNA-binding domain-containing protein n=1 Tax=Schizopora paradoxa TaxID=27342 RepID=A0A0H2RVQ6_9AGAM|nr:winged helix DNA-binding domain-containing protein [Schizopora paradoxa]